MWYPIKFGDFSDAFVSCSLRVGVLGMIMNSTDPWVNNAIYTREASLMSHRVYLLLKSTIIVCTIQYPHFES